MKTWLLLALVGWAISFAVPTFAQEQKAVDPETGQQIEAVNTKLGEAMKKHDATAAADLYTLSALEYDETNNWNCRNGFVLFKS